MSGKCFGCSAAFGFFKKEHGCKNCGFAFCSSCLPHKEPVPKHHNQRLPVCINCHLILTGKKKQTDPSKYSPPEVLKKRLAALDDPKEPQRKAVPTAKSSKGKMSSEDVLLEERLLKLKEDRKQAAAAAKQPKDSPKDAPVGPLPSDQEMADRLAKLRGLPSEGQRPQQQPFPTEKRSDQQQIDDLLMQISDEVQIDSRSNEDRSTEEPPMTGAAAEAAEDELSVDEVHRLIKKVAEEAEMDAEKATEALKKDDELWSRLKQLKEERKKKGGEKSAEEDEEDEEEDEEAASLKVIQKILAEHELDEKSGRTAADDDDDEELPWCCICNENATLRCHGCDEDLYCQRCFREGHARFEMTDHTTERYTKKK